MMNPWSLFWRQGHSTTFGDYFKQGYEGAVANWWQAVLTKTDPKAVVMEVGCGNCSLLPGMIECDTGARYIGVDLASVKLSTVAEQRLGESGIQVTLHPETAAESIPEPDLSVDLVASVFGIEYSDLERSLPEVMRLLKPGQQFCALLHHDASVVTAMSRRAISEYNAEDVATIIECLTTISIERDKAGSIEDLKKSQDAEKSRKIINSMAEKYLGSTDPRSANATMFEFTTNALRFFKIIGSDSALRQQFISSLVDEHEASHERFRQMVSVALGKSAIEEFQAKLHALGFSSIRADVIRIGFTLGDQSDDTRDPSTDILAWEICAEK